MYQRILVPIDGSSTSKAGLAEATKLAKLTGGRIRLLHVVDPLPITAEGGEFGAALTVDDLRALKGVGEAVLQEARTMVEKNAIEVDDILLDSTEGRLADRVLEQAEAWRADLLVLGTHGRRGVRRMLLGSDAEQIVRTVNLPALLVHGE
jgi:nucleotide-binding universal stress UspA family protein